MIGERVRIHHQGSWYHGKIGVIVERSIYGWRIDIDQPQPWMERICWFGRGQVYTTSNQAA